VNGPGIPDPFYFVLVSISSRMGEQGAEFSGNYSSSRGFRAEHTVRESKRGGNQQTANERVTIMQLTVSYSLAFFSISDR
jgi:hypothetical protein